MEPIDRRDASLTNGRHGVAAIDLRSGAVGRRTAAFSMWLC